MSAEKIKLKYIMANSNFLENQVAACPPFLIAYLLWNLDEFVKSN
jgi:hypothetical protein